MHTVLAKNLHVERNKDKILILLYSSKTHGKESNPQEIKITGVKSNDASPRFRQNNKNRFHCPFQIIRSYLNIRGNYLDDSEYLFIFRDRQLVKPFHMAQVLKTILKCLNINEKLYSVHSFRIGRTNELFKHGIDIETIKKVGCWKSNVVYKYLCNIYQEIEF